MSSDIVLMQLHRPVEFSSQVLPACLPDTDLQLDPFTSCWITGWGMLTENSEHTGQAKWVWGWETRVFQLLKSLMVPSVLLLHLLKISNFQNQKLGSVTLSHL